MEISIVKEFVKTLVIMDIMVMILLLFVLYVIHRVNFAQESWLLNVVTVVLIIICWEQLVGLIHNVLMDIGQILLQENVNLVLLLAKIA